MARLARDRIAGDDRHAQREQQEQEQREHYQRQEYAVAGKLIQERRPAPRTGGRRERQPEHDSEEHRDDRQHPE